MTGLPFVFAVWAVRRSYGDEHPDAVRRIWNLLQDSKKQGLAHLPEIARESAGQIGIDPEVAKLYFKSMYYHMDAPDQNCLLEFFRRLYDGGLVKKPPVLNFWDPEKASGKAGKGE